MSLPRSQSNSGLVSRREQTNASLEKDKEILFRSQGIRPRRPWLSIDKVSYSVVGTVSEMLIGTFTVMIRWETV